MTLGGGLPQKPFGGEDTPTEDNEAHHKADRLKHLLDCLAEMPTRRERIAALAYCCTELALPVPHQAWLTNTRFHQEPIKDAPARTGHVRPDGYWRPHGIPDDGPPSPAMGITTDQQLAIINGDTNRGKGSGKTVAVSEVYALCESLEAEADRKYLEHKPIKEAEAGFWRGQKHCAKTIRKAIGAIV